MKKIYAIVLSLLPLFGFGQFDVEWVSEEYQEGYQGDDIGFDYDLINVSDGDIDITWEFTHILASSEDDWQDYFCEGDLVCHPAETRTNTFTLDSGETMPIYQHIQTFDDGDSGTWVSTAIIYQADDSANTRVEMVVTAKTGIVVTIDGKDVYIMNGDSLELYGNEFVPLSVESAAFEDEGAFLEQNAPNPFAGMTTINYQLEGDNGLIRFHDLTGKLVKELPLNSHSGQVTMRGDLDAGIYFYSLWEDGAMVDSRRMQVIE